MGCDFTVLAKNIVPADAMLEILATHLEGHEGIVCVRKGKTRTCQFDHKADCKDMYGTTIIIE